MFTDIINQAIKEDKCVIDYKPKKNVKRIVYKAKSRKVTK